MVWQKKKTAEIEQSSPVRIRDRIKELRRVPASELLANPKNWRTHPEEQRSALQGILGEIGIAEALVAYETSAGLMLIDGHLRADAAPDSEWPVLILDVNEQEADKLLATLDPLAAMAERDVQLFSELISELMAAEAACWDASARTPWRVMNSSPFCERMT